MSAHERDVVRSGQPGLETLLVLAAVAAIALLGCRSRRSGASHRNESTAMPAAPHAPGDDATTYRGPHAVQIVAGYAHSCVRMNDGLVRCWGTNHDGVLADIPYEQPTRPVVVQAFGHATRIAAGWEHTCVWHEDGVMRCWGMADFIRGDGVTPPTRVVTREEGFRDVVDVALQGRAPCFLLRDRTVECVQGGSAFGTPPPVSLVRVEGLANVDELSVRFDRDCARVRDGTIYCWGSSSVSATGVATWDWMPQREVSIPSTVGFFAAPSYLCARNADGTTRCWGQIAQAPVLGEDAESFERPTVVPELANAVQIVAGSQHACARIADGSVTCWGSNEMGQLGTPCSMPGYQRCEETNTYASSDAASGHRYFCRSRPFVVPGLHDVVDLAAGTDHTCALRRDGRVFCWGSNQFGQLGDGTTADRDVPTEVIGLASTAVAGTVAIAARADGRSQLTGCLEYATARLTPRRNPGPIVALGHPTVTGGLAPEAVRRVVQRYLGQIAHCQEQALALDPNAEANVTLSFVIAPDGTVSPANVTLSNDPMAGRQRCVIRRVPAWQFPLPASGASVTVAFPIMLRSPL